MFESLFLLLDSLCKKMVKAFTRLYIRQFGRLLRELGLWRRIFLLLLIIMLFLVLISKVNSHSPFIAIAAFVSLLTLHFQRKDRQFLKILNIDEKLLFFVHYHLLALPLYLVFGLFLQHNPWFCFIVKRSTNESKYNDGTKGHHRVLKKYQR